MKILALLALIASAAGAQTTSMNPPFSVSIGGQDWTGQGCVGFGNAAGWVWGFVTKDAAGTPHVKLDYCDGQTGLWLAIALDNAAQATPGPQFSDAETPAGSLDGKNATFTLAHAPVAGSVPILVWNGVVQKLGGDYQLQGSAITLARAPGSGDSLLVWYRY